MADPETASGDLSHGCAILLFTADKLVHHICCLFQPSTYSQFTWLQRTPRPVQDAQNPHRVVVNRKQDAVFVAALAVELLANFLKEGVRFGSERAMLGNGFQGFDGLEQP